MNASLALVRAIALPAAVAAWALAAGPAAAQSGPSPAPLPPDAPPTAARPALRTAAGILDAANPDLVLTLRAGVQVSPAYLGSDDYEVGPDVAARLDYIRLPGGFEFGSGRTVGFREGWGIRGSARYLGERDPDEHDEISGLDNVDWSFELGLGVGYEQRNWRAFTDVRYGVIGHNAWVGEVGADSIAYPMDGLTLTLGPRLSFGTDNFARTYFGVSEQESVASDLPAFDAKGGLLGAGMELGARYRFNERWGVEGAASWNRLVNDAADSPVTENGSADQYEIRLGVTRSISLDF
ncbi:MipA/OmpV family protein [Amaricoccus sp.]|uniref:MipA/OmpV family protein n=1 Tax=Amaricoccus sp. TaxID=1872485 RepID=UPI00260F8963|nr:MipA/OmpV family protein [Amaricoccus sp.]HRO11613.1 MipA/OmpV family protein [Amaricoccus sp.]